VRSCGAARCGVARPHALSIPTNCCLSHGFYEGIAPCVRPVLPRTAICSVHASVCAHSFTVAKDNRRSVAELDRAGLSPLLPRDSLVALTTATKERGGRASLWPPLAAFGLLAVGWCCLPLRLCSGRWLLARLVVARRSVLLAFGLRVRVATSRLGSCGPTVRALVALEGIVDLLQARTLIAFGASGGPI
jgi:hypothetical protein